MEVELAEQKLKTMEHSEQHYFKRYVFFVPISWARVSANEKPCVEIFEGDCDGFQDGDADLCLRAVTIIMVRIHERKSMIPCRRIFYLT